MNIEEIEKMISQAQQEVRNAVGGGRENQKFIEGLNRADDYLSNGYAGLAALAEKISDDDLRRLMTIIRNDQAVVRALSGAATEARKITLTRPPLPESWEHDWTIKKNDALIACLSGRAITGIVNLCGIVYDKEEMSNDAEIEMSEYLRHSIIQWSSSRWNAGKGYKEAVTPLQLISCINNDKTRALIYKTIKRPNAYSLLHYAASGGDLELVKTIIETHESVGESVDISAKAENGSTPLFCAAFMGHLEIVKYLIKKGAGVDDANSFGHAPLHVAAFYGHMTTVELLLGKEANVFVRNKNKETPLHLAARWACSEIVTALIKNANESNRAIDYILMKSSKGESALHEAAKSGEISTFMRIIECLPDCKKTDVRDDEGRTPVHTAAEYGQRDLIKWMFENPDEIGGPVSAAVSQGGLTALHCAAKYGRYETAEILSTLAPELLEKGENSGNLPCDYARWNGYDKVADLLTGKSRLHIAAEKGDYEGVKSLLKELYEKNIDKADRRKASRNASLKSYLQWRAGGREINRQDALGNTPLYYAAEKGYLQIVKLLLQFGSYENKLKHRDYSPLEIAMENGFTEIVKCLLEGGDKLNEGDVTLNVNIASSGHTEILRLLAEHGIDITGRKTTEFMKKTGHPYSPPIYLAARQGHHSTVELLIDKGADASEVTSQELWGLQAPLHGAAYKGCCKSAHLLLRAGAEVDSTNIEGETPLHVASKKGHCSLAKELIERGADVNCQTVFGDGVGGDTPLHLAAAEGHGDIVKLLLENGADIKIKDQCGNGAQYYATKKGHLSVASLLNREGNLGDSFHRGEGRGGSAQDDNTDPPPEYL